MRKQIRKLNDETGVTLVELLAAIAILSIIVTAFLGFFIQAAKTNQHTNAVNEATFLAQEEIERVIYKSAANSVDSIGQSEKESSYKIETKIEEIEDSDLHKVIVTVSEGGKVRAKMETRLPFFKEDTE